MHGSGDRGCDDWLTRTVLYRTDCAEIFPIAKRFRDYGSLRVLICPKNSRYYFPASQVASFWKRGSFRSVGGKLQLGVNAEQRTGRWRFRTEVADETILGADLDVTGSVLGAVY